MNFGVAAATFAVVLPAELPDKTFLASIVLSSRHRPLPVFFGAASGLIVQAVVAVIGGRLLALAPHRVVAAIVTAVFFAGAVFLAFGSKKHATDEGEGIVEREEQLAATDAIPIPRRLPAARIAFATFAVVTLAEFGDLTQIVIANLAAKTSDALGVFVGACAAFIVTAALGVSVGSTLTRHVSLAVVRRISAVILFGLGIWSALTAAGV